MIFVYVPIIWSVVLSFSGAQNTVTPGDCVGLAQLRRPAAAGPVPGQPAHLHGLRGASSCPLTFALSLGLALLLNRITFVRAFFRSVFFLPTACSYVVASLIWKLSIFNGVRFGLANTVLGWFGVDNIAWLATTDPPWYWLVIVTRRLWLQVGFYMILFLAGLQRISPELYEAAAIDGARNGLADLPLHHPAAAAGHLGGGPAAAPDRRLPGLRRVLQPASATPPSPDRRWSTSTTPRRATRTTGTAARARSSWPC